MNQKPQTIALVAILAIGSGLAGFSFATEGATPTDMQSTSFAVKPLLNGHLKLVVTDSEGNVKGVREADNIITQQGENCAIRLLFTPGAAHTGSTSGGTNNNCAGAFTNGFQFIGVGTGVTQEVGTQAQLVTESTGNNLDRKQATTITFTNATGAETGVSSQIVLATTFSSVTGGPHSISEAGLFNSTLAPNTDAMFARKTFAPVTVNTGDSLTVSWTIQIGNTTSFN